LKDIIFGNFRFVQAFRISPELFEALFDLTVLISCWTQRRKHL